MLGKMHTTRYYSCEKPQRVDGGGANSVSTPFNTRLRVLAPWHQPNGLVGRLIASSDSVKSSSKVLDGLHAVFENFLKHTNAFSVSLNIGRHVRIRRMEMQDFRIFGTWLDEPNRSGMRSSNEKSCARVRGQIVFGCDVFFDIFMAVSFGQQMLAKCDDICKLFHVTAGINHDASNQPFDLLAEFGAQIVQVVPSQFIHARH